MAYDSLLAGITCCDAIAWLEHARTRNRKGTGFVLSGELLDPRLGPQPLLLTNAHVLDDDRSTDAMEPASARVCFEQGPDKGRKIGVAEVLWVSPRRELDVCVARLSEPPTSSLPPPAQCLPALSERHPPAGHATARAAPSILSPCWKGSSVVSILRGSSPAWRARPASRGPCARRGSRASPAMPVAARSDRTSPSCSRRRRTWPRPKGSSAPAGASSPTWGETRARASSTCTSISSAAAG